MVWLPSNLSSARKDAESEPQRSDNISQKEANEASSPKRGRTASNSSRAADDSDESLGFDEDGFASLSIVDRLKSQLDDAIAYGVDETTAILYPTELMWLCALPGECKAMDETHSILIGALRNFRQIEDVREYAQYLVSLDPSIANKEEDDAEDDASAASPAVDDELYKEAMRLQQEQAARAEEEQQPSNAAAAATAIAAGSESEVASPQSSNQQSSDQGTGSDDLAILDDFDPEAILKGFRGNSDMAGNGFGPFSSNTQPDRSDYFTMPPGALVLLKGNENAGGKGGMELQVQEAKHPRMRSRRADRDQMQDRWMFSCARRTRARIERVLRVTVWALAEVVVSGIDSTTPLDSILWAFGRVFRSSNDQAAIVSALHALSILCEGDKDTLKKVMQHKLAKAMVGFLTSPPLICKPALRCVGNVVCAETGVDFT